MPKRRRTTKKRRHGRKRRKTYRRRSKRRSRASTLTLRSPSAFPDSIYVKMRYTDLVTISWDTNAIPGIARYALNSPFDPQVSGGGAYNTQAYGFDQWAAIYNIYRCAGSSIRVRAIPSTNSFDAYHWRLSVFPTVVSSASVSDIPLQYQIPYSKTVVGNVYQGRATSISHYMSVRKLAGVTKTTFEGDPFYASVITTDPANQMYWMLVANQSNQRTGAPAGIDCTVDLTYYVQFYNRKLVASS